MSLKTVYLNLRDSRIVYVGLLVLFISVIVLASYACRSAVTNDQWHFLNLINNYYQHGFSFRDVWEAHGPHRTPGYKILFLLDAIYFHLNLKLEIYAGILALLAMSVMIYLRYLDSMRDKVSNLGLQLRFLVIAIVIFSFNQWMLYFYSLTSLDGFLGKMLFVWIWCYMDKGIRRSLSYGFIWKFCLAFLLIVLIFGEGMGMALIFSAIIVMLLNGFSIHAWGDRKYQVLLIATVLTAILSQLIYWGIPPGIPPNGHNGNLFDAMLVVFTQPWGTVEYTLTTLGSSLLNDAWRQISEQADVATYVTGAIVISGYLIATWLFYRYRMWQKTWLPLIMMLYSILFLGLLLVGRYGTGLDSAGAPRYATDLQLGIVGILWVFYFARNSKQSPTRKWMKSLVVCTTLFVLIMQTGSVLLMTHVAPQQRNRNLSFVQAIMTRKPGELLSNPPPFCRRKPTRCLQGVAILKKYGLRPFYPPSDYDRQQ
jgi:hypothetical protein